MLEVIEKIKQGQMFAKNDRWGMLEFALSLVKIPGNYIELGVYKGESLTWIAERIFPNLVWGFDWYKGLPEDLKDSCPQGMFSLNYIPSFRAHNIRTISGPIEKTTREISFLDPIIFIHVDCDLYSPTKAALEQLELGKGVVIMFDELYGSEAYDKNELKALSEFDKEWEPMAYSDSKAVIRLT